MSASKTDLRLATVQPDLLLSFSLLYFCHFYHVTIWKITAEIHSQGSFLHAPHTERVTRKRRPWERGNRNKLHRLKRFRELPIKIKIHAEKNKS